MLFSIVIAYCGKLETLGVPVVGYQTDEFPAFFTPHSGCEVRHRADTPEECAGLILASRELGLEGGVLFAVPIPAHAAADGIRIEAAIQRALAEADEQGVGGKEITPFILKRVNELTDGASLEANIALVMNNAKVGAEIAVALSAMSELTLDPPAPPAPEALMPEVVVVGGLVLDVVSTSPDLVQGTSNPGMVQQSLGGVGKNIAESAGRVTGGTAASPAAGGPLLISAVGGDAGADALIAGCHQAGITSEGVIVVEEARSAVYNAIHHADGDLMCGVVSALQ